MKLKLFYIVVFITFCVGNIESKPQPNNEIIEQGRTLVHNTVKRFMILLPAIFFKLGIAFTLLILVALATVNNGFVGFLILVVGLSSVLARFQEPAKAAVGLPYVHHVPAPAHYHQVWDRSDTATSLGDRNQETKVYYNGVEKQNYEFSNSPQLSSYYAKYASGKR